MAKEIRFIKLDQVQGLVSYSAPQIWRLEQVGKFPKRIRIGDNRVAWLHSEVEDWMNSKIERSRTDV